MKTLDVKRIRVTFDGRWRVVQPGDESPSYRQGLGRLHGTKAVDVIALDDENCWLFEMKDFRGYRIENRGRVGAALAEEVAAKVRDTIAAMVWMQGRAGCPAEPELTRLLKVLLNQSLRAGPVKVVLWLDQDRQAPVASVLAELIKRELKPWLDVRVIVTSTAGQECWKTSAGVRAKNLAGVGRAR